MIVKLLNDNVKPCEVRIDALPAVVLTHRPDEWLKLQGLTVISQLDFDDVDIYVSDYEHLRLEQLYRYGIGTLVVEGHDNLFNLSSLLDDSGIAVNLFTVVRGGDD